MPGPAARVAEPAPGPTLAERIARRIAREGPMSLAEYMAVALGDPEQGYYMQGDPFGARGDFVTAPEVSQMFGELLGLWCAETWSRMGAPDPVHLVELGPGRGTLMADALRAARRVPGFLQALRLSLVEISPALRARQRDALQRAALHRDPQWHHTLAEVPRGPLLLLANEFFDALPVRQFVRNDGAWCERMVALAEDGRTLVFVLRPARLEAAALLPREAEATPEGGTFEVSPAASGVAAEIGGRLAEDGGAALILDYGAVRPLGEPTLQALRRHARHEVLSEPGTADLTAHVDFAALARGAGAAGAKAWDPMPQGAFLRALGIEARAEALSRDAAPDKAQAIAEDLERLTEPEEMGALFKALALSHPEMRAPAGFG